MQLLPFEAVSLRYSYLATSHLRTVTEPAFFKSAGISRWQLCYDQQSAIKETAARCTVGRFDFDHSKCAINTSQNAATSVSCQQISFDLKWNWSKYSPKGCLGHSLHGLCVQWYGPTRQIGMETALTSTATGDLLFIMSAEGAQNEVTHVGQPRLDYCFQSIECSGPFSHSRIHLKFCIDYRPTCLCGHGLYRSALLSIYRFADLGRILKSNLEFCTSHETRDRVGCQEPPLWPNPTPI